MPCGQTELPGVHTVYFEGCYIVYNGNKRRTKTKETECECHGTRKMRILCPIENKVSQAADQVISDIKERTDAQKSARSVCRLQLFLSGFLLAFRCICRERGFIFIQHSADHSLINEDWFRCSQRHEDQFGTGIGFPFRNSRTYALH